MKRVIITGKNGSLSIAVAEYLSKNGMDILQISLRSDAWLDYDFSNYDTIVHIAGITPQNKKDTDDYFKINCDITNELAIKCKNEGVKQFVYLSSMSVYGVIPNRDIVKGTIDKASEINPLTDYGKSKLLAEQCLQSLQSNLFDVSIIRVPSVYGIGKTEYMDKYREFAKKLPVIPLLYKNNYRSVININNLCELIRLIIISDSAGVFCPDDGQYSVVDFMCAMYPQKRQSRILGKLIEIVFKNSSKIGSGFGTVAYTSELSGVFEGDYRIVRLVDELRSLYNYS